MLCKMLQGCSYSSFSYITADKKNSSFDRIGWSVSAVVKGVVIARGLRFNSLAGRIRHSVATTSTLLRSCVVQTLNGGDEPRHSLHASA